MSLYKNKAINKSIAQHMTDFMKLSVEDKKFNYDKYRVVFNKTVNILEPLGSQIFRYNNNDVFSTAVYDTTMIGIAENIHLYGNVKPAVIRNKINEIKTDEVYQKLTRSGGNNSVQRVKKRIEFSKQIFGTLK